MARPHILLCNDDGILAKGIYHLWRSLKDHADITIVAPADEKSATGVSITAHHPLRCHETRWEEDTPAYRVTGTPADCVKLALSVVLDNPPDLICSGINLGSNAGRNVLYSGTVGAVIEGALRGVPGIAFSTHDMQEPAFEACEPHVMQVVDYVLDNPLPAGTLLNVNFPGTIATDYKGMRLARQGRSYWLDNPMLRMDPMGTPYHWIGGKLYQGDEPDDGDIALLRQGFATAVPIHVDDLTDVKSFEARKAAFDERMDAGVPKGT